MFAPCLMGVDKSHLYIQSELLTGYQHYYNTVIKKDCLKSIKTIKVQVNSYFLL
jgi:hypothetical protein